jgi:glycosyltransferase involved in cell wall biosynthesis
MNILIVTPTLGFGGAERVISLLASDLLGRGHQVKILVLNGHAPKAYHFENTEFWKFSNVRKAIPKLYFFLGRNQYDLVFSSARNVNYYLAIARKLGFIKVLVVRDNSVISQLKNFVSWKTRTFIQCFSYTYRWADAIICQSRDMLHDLLLTNNIPESKLHLIHNPVNVEWKPGILPNIKGQLVSVGRLSAEKGYSRLIQAMYIIRIHPWFLHIYGTGPEYENLKELINTLHLEDRVILHGTSQRISEVLQKSHVFLTASYVEGFPNSVLEASICGLPVVAMDCPGGTKEIVNHGVNGYLVKKEEDFGKFVLQAMEKEWLTNMIAVETGEKFDQKRIVDQYELLFKQLIHV